VVDGARDALGRLEQQGLGRRLQGAGVDAHFGQARVQVIAQGLGRPGSEPEAEAQAGDQRAVDAQVEPREQVLVAAQHQRERGLGVAPRAGEQAQFLEGGDVEVLRFLDHDAVDAIQMLFSPTQLDKIAMHSFNLRYLLARQAAGTAGAASVRG